MALDVDATLEHVQDPQGTVKVQVRSHLTEMETRLCLGGSFFKDVNTFRLQIMIHLISNNGGFLCFGHSFRNWFVCSALC